MTKRNDQLDASTWFKSYAHIWAVSKEARGASYTLDDNKYEELVKAVTFATELVDHAIDFVQQAGAGGLSSKKLVTRDGKLTDLGLIADHFNLIKALKYEGPEDCFIRGSWSLAPGFKPSTPDISLQTLYDTVLKCLQFTSNGLRGGVKFRGIDSNELAGRKIFGKVVARRGSLARTKDGQRVEDKFHTDRNYEVKDWRFGKKTTYKVMPALPDDRIFLAEDAQLLGAIHVDYAMIDTWTAIFGGLANEDATLSWTIVHEATHKFARTRDVNNAYTIAECRQLHWHSALRNASHYERFAGLDLSKARGKPSFRVSELIRDC